MGGGGGATKINQAQRGPHAKNVETQIQKTMWIVTSRLMLLGSWLEASVLGDACTNTTCMGKSLGKRLFWRPRRWEMGEYTEMDLWVKLRRSERLQMVFSCVTGISGTDSSFLSLSVNAVNYSNEWQLVHQCSGVLIQGVWLQNLQTCSKDNLHSGRDANQGRPNANCRWRVGFHLNESKDSSNPAPS